MADEYQNVRTWRVKLGPLRGIGWNMAQAFGVQDTHFDAGQEGEWELILRKKGSIEGTKIING